MLAAEQILAQIGIGRCHQQRAGGDVRDAKNCLQLCRRHKAEFFVSNLSRLARAFATNMNRTINDNDSIEFNKI